MEAGEVGQGSVVVGHILAGVRVSHRDEVDVHAVCLHGSRRAARRSGTVFMLMSKSLLSLFCRKKRPAAMVCYTLLYHSGAQNAIRRVHFGPAARKCKQIAKNVTNFSSKRAGLPLTACYNRSVGILRVSTQRPGLLVRARRACWAAPLRRLHKRKRHFEYDQDRYFLRLPWRR